MTKLSLVVTIMAAVAVLAVLQFDCVADDSVNLYVNKGNWADTMLASRTKYFEWWTAQSGGFKFSPWYVAASIKPNSFGESFSPGDRLDTELLDDNGNRVWQAHLEMLDGVVFYDLADAPVKYAYLSRIIRSSSATKKKAWVGARTGLDVWLNGSKIFSNRKLGNGHYPEADQAEIELDLKAGKNELVLNFSGPRWGGFYFSMIASDQLDPDPFDVLIDQIERDYPVQTYYMHRDAKWEQIDAWFRYVPDTDLPLQLVLQSIENLEGRGRSLVDHFVKLMPDGHVQNVRSALENYSRAAELRKAGDGIDSVDFAALRRAINDLAKTFPDQYLRSEEYLERADKYEAQVPVIKAALDQRLSETPLDTVLEQAAEIVDFEREVLLANPLLDFDKLLVVQRRPADDPRRARALRGLCEFLGMPRQSSFQNHKIGETHGWDNEIAVLNGLDDGGLNTIYRPAKPRLVSDVDLHFDSDKLLFSSVDDNSNWQVYEMNLASGSTVKQLTPSDPDDVHNFDACYLPNGRIVFISTAPIQGVPCNAGVIVGMSYLMDGDGANIRQIAFDQDHNYYPSVMNDGRILYLRWEYTDIPHVWARILFTMNPDGTCQREFYGSASYWPNSIFFAKAIPNHPTKVVGIVTGHHIGREGELVIFDAAEGRTAPSGVVQRIPGYGKTVEPLIEDKLTEESWPKFLQPHPLSENYFIVSCKPSPRDLWGIYLVDTFDNMVLLKEVEGQGLFEPIPVRNAPTPPVIMEKVDLAKDDGIMYIEDIYKGPGLKDVPRGTVKELRLFTYHFAYQKLAGIGHKVGVDGPWEPKRVLGTVPVEEDGSAMFKVPANTPISIQPLDENKNALQLMRSWTTAMPGEVVSCVGCHEEQNDAPASGRTIASLKDPDEIEAWHGEVRGFSFKREVQPVLDKYCVSCHDGSASPDLRSKQDEYIVYKTANPQGQSVKSKDVEKLFRQYKAVFEPSYIALRGYVRVGGLESDLRLLNPGEFHTNTSELFQMLEKGHYGVKLNKEAWDRLATWVDLNAPCHGTWREAVGSAPVDKFHERRIALRKMYADDTADPEAIPAPPKRAVIPVKAVQQPLRVYQAVDAPGWPFDKAEARQRQATNGQTKRSIELGNGLSIELTLVPAGTFVMGDSKGHDDEQPSTRVSIDKPFWMASFEMTNEQFNQFNPEHDSRFEHRTSWIFSEEGLGWLLNHPKQPVVRVSYDDATAFCQWLSDKIGEKVTLPTEAQWEYACRAGTGTALSFGGLDTDFASHANMADAMIRDLAYEARNQYMPDLVPRDDRFNDKVLVTSDVGAFKANAWGLYDMHGNVAEWTRSVFKQYPYNENDGRNTSDAAQNRVVRGGSWRDRPKRCTSSFRLSYPQWQRVFNVGFRIAIEVSDKSTHLAQATK